MNTPEMVGQRIYQSRIAIYVDGKPMTQARLAAKIVRFTRSTLSRNSISLWEKGDVKAITYLNMLGLADALKKNPEWIRTGKGPERLEDSYSLNPPVPHIPRLSVDAIEIAAEWSELEASVQKCIALLIRDLSGFTRKKVTKARSHR